MKYCNSCNQNVNPTKRFSIGWFLVNCIWILGAPVYLLYWVFIKTKTCPICGNNHLEVMQENLLDIEISKEEQWDNKLAGYKTTAEEAHIKSSATLEKATAKHAEAKIKFAAARQKVKDESNARVLARQQKNKNI